MRHRPVGPTRPTILISASLLALAALALASSVRAQGAALPDAAKIQAAASTPDLSGVWTQHAPPNARAYALYALAKDEPPMTPWAEAKFKENKPSFGPRSAPDSNDPVNPTTGTSVGCFPPGVPRIYQHPFPMEIIQVPGRVIMIFEFDHHVRQIYTDGRGHNKDLPPLWMGDSIGKWEGDTLVVDTTNFTEKTHFRGTDRNLHLVERFTRTGADTIQYRFTIEDPTAFTRPWTGEIIMSRALGPLYEYACHEGNYSLANMLAGARAQEKTEAGEAPGKTSK